MNKELKPFNLEDAKAGNAVITRDGHDVKILDFEFKLTSDTIQLIGKIEFESSYQVAYKWYIDGKFSEKELSEMDLFMKTETKSVWVNFYKKTSYSTSEGFYKFISCGSCYESEQKARSDINDMFGIYIETKQIEITL